MNKNGNLIENIRELIRNHVEHLVKNDDMLKEKEIFERFRQKAQPLVKTLEEYKDILEKNEANQLELGNLFLLSASGLKDFEHGKEELSKSIKNASEEIKELEYEKLSFEYHKEDEELQSLKSGWDSIEKEIDILKDELKESNFKKNILHCAKLVEELKNLNSKISKFETELDKESLQQEDVKKLLCDIEFTLKKKYEEKVLYIKNTIDQENALLKGEKTSMEKELDRADVLKKEEVSLNDQIIKLRGRIAVFEESRKMLMETYHQFKLTGNKDGGYSKESVEELKDELSKEEEEIKNNIKEISLNRKSNLENLEVSEVECKKLREENTELAVEKSRKDSLIASFEADQKGILKILSNYQLGEESLFERERLIEVLNTEKEKYSKVISDRALENSLLRERKNMYGTGRLFELSKEIKDILNERNIFVQFGYEWLRGLDENKNKKLKLIKNNPFLPYSIIVSKKDLEEIGDISFDVFSTSVIPVIERENLEKSLEIRSKNNIYSMKDLDFLVPFDDRTLNKNYIKEMCDEIEDKLQKSEDIIQSAKEAVKNIDIDIIKIEGFNYTKESVEALYKDYKNILETINANIAGISEMESRICQMKKTDEDYREAQRDFENRGIRFQKKKEDIEFFISKCQAYMTDLQNKALKEEKIKVSEDESRNLQGHILKIRDKIKDQEIKIANISSLLQREKESLAKYAHVQEGNLIDETIDNLEAKRESLRSELSGKIDTLQDILEDYRHEKGEKERTLNGYGLDQKDYLGKEYNKFEYDSINIEIQNIEEKINGLSSNGNDLQYKMAEKTSDLKHMKRNILQRCGYDKPKERENIRELDFEEEKVFQTKRLKEAEKELNALKSKENQLQRLKYLLDEYEDFALKVQTVSQIEGDMEEQVKNSIKNYKKHMELLNNIKEGLASVYADVESEFYTQGEIFKGLFGSILDGDKKYKPVHALNALGRVFMQIERKLEQHSIDIKKIDSMETCIIDNTLGYILNVYDELNTIDRNSTIDIDGKMCKMLIINLPQKDQLENISLKEYLKNAIRNCVNLYKSGKGIDGVLNNEISTYDLFDRLVGVKKIGITLMKIELNKLKKKTWNQVIVENSGGEKFVSAFVVFISLLTYMRGDNFLGQNLDSKVLIMDNPFGPITSEHLLKPLFEISKKYNTQLICLTDLKEHTVFDRFNLIYSLNIEREVGREDEYIEIKTVKKDVVEEEDEVITLSMFRIENKSRFELVN